MKSQLFKSPLPYIALLLAHIIWGGNFVVAKITLQEFPPMSLAFLRFSLAFLLLIPFLLTSKDNDLTKAYKNIKKYHHLPKIILMGVLIVTLNIAFFYEGMQRTLAIDASVLSLVGPIISVLAGWWILKEKIYWINLAGILIGFSGAMTVIGLPLIFAGSFNTQNLLGNLLILLSSISAVSGMLLVKDMVKTYPPLLTTMLMFLVGAITFLIPAILEYLNKPDWIANITILGVLGVLYIIILSSICAFFLLIWALSKIDISKASLAQYIEPAIAATLAVPLLGERISYSFIVGTLMVVLGVYWGTLGKAAHHHLLHRHHRT